jgi:hypothetical protein
MDAEMPFLLETKLRDLGTNFVNKPSFTDPIEIDGNFIAGQDPMSSESFAKRLFRIEVVEDSSQFHGGMMTGKCTRKAGYSTAPLFLSRIARDSAKWRYPAALGWI